MWTSVCCGWLLPQCFGGGLAVMDPIRYFQTRTRREAACPELRRRGVAHLACPVPDAQCAVCVVGVGAACSAHRVIRVPCAEIVHTHTSVPVAQNSHILRTFPSRTRGLVPEAHACLRRAVVTRHAPGARRKCAKCGVRDGRTCESRGEEVATMSTGRTRRRARGCDVHPDSV